MRSSKVKRDDSDFKKLIQWYSSYNTFLTASDKMSISNSVLGPDEGVNIHLAQEIGSSSMAGNVNENFEDSHFRRKNAVVSTEIVTNRLKRSQGKNIVDRLMIFHRKFVPKQFDDDLKEYFK